VCVKKPVRNRVLNSYQSLPKAQLTFERFKLKETNRLSSGSRKLEEVEEGV